MQVYYVNQTGQSTQTACLAGTYQATTGQMAATDADAGYYVDQTGQSSQTACSAGTYQASTAQSSCDDADAGYYVPVNRSIQSNSMCELEPIKHIQVRVPAIDADAGTMLIKQVNPLKLRVLTGTYQSATGQASCYDADAGHYVPTTGQTERNSMSRHGTYQPDTGQDGCDDADAGSLRSNNWSNTQLMCNWNLSI